jgi:hypothetical protein
MRIQCQRFGCEMGSPGKKDSRQYVRANSSARHRLLHRKPFGCLSAASFWSQSPLRAVSHSTEVSSITKERQVGAPAQGVSVHMHHSPNLCRAAIERTKCLWICRRVDWQEADVPRALPHLGQGLKMSELGNQNVPWARNWTHGRY